ncbi:hypothetical protein ACLOJK_010236, partial [Asimina triloba]
YNRIARAPSFVDAEKKRRRFAEISISQGLRYSAAAIPISGFSRRFALPLRKIRTFLPSGGRVSVWALQDDFEEE